MSERIRNFFQHTPVKSLGGVVGIIREGGEIGHIRPGTIDQGWLPSTRLVGKSGKSVKPKLYLALGISGAPEHVEGMRDSEFIIAINTDPNAPIFDIAQYGSTLDLLDLLPTLNEATAEGLHA